MNNWMIDRRSCRSMVGRIACWSLLCGIILTGVAIVHAQAQPVEGAASETGEVGFESDPGWLLFPTQDESSLERVIAKYFKMRRQWNVVIREIAEKDVDLQLNFSFDDEAPKVKLFLDSTSSNRDGDVVVERRIFVKYHYVLPESAKTPEMRQKLMEFNNNWILKSWTPYRIMIDKDGDLQFEGQINIPHKNVPIHAESVLDLTERMLSGWKEYYPGMSEEIGL